MTATMEAKNGVASERRHPMWFKDLMGGEWSAYEGGTYHVGLVTFTPKVAALVLDNHNKENRRPVQTQISNLTRDVASGNFPVTMETIIFNTNRNLINGQNRMSACVLADKPFVSFVGVGADPDVFKVLDQHSKRTAGQVLQMAGEVSANNLASSLMHLQRVLVCGDLRTSSIRGEGQLDTRLKSMTIPERFELLERCPDLREHCSYFSLNQKQARIFPGIGMPAALRFLFNESRPQYSTKFWDSLMECSIPEDSRWNATRLLLKRLVANRTENDRHVKLSVRRVGALTIKAFNAVVENESLSHLQWQEREDFPRIAGLRYSATTGGVEIDS